MKYIAIFIFGVVIGLFIATEIARNKHNEEKEVINKIVEKELNYSPEKEKIINFIIDNIEQGKIVRNDNHKKVIRIENDTIGYQVEWVHWKADEYETGLNHIFITAKNGKDILYYPSNLSNTNRIRKELYKTFRKIIIEL